MNDLIKINCETSQPTVSARDLHDGLEIKTALKDWFPRMVEYGFEEGRDFSSKMSQSTGGRPAMDYDISVDMAKQICMIQRTEKGRQYRQYFLDLEKAWNTPEQVFARALKMADQKIIELRDKTNLLETEVKVKDQIIGELKPKADYTDLILNNSGLVTITQIAKDYGMTGTAMNDLLHELHVQYKQSNQWLLYAQYHSLGYTHSKTVDITHKNGTPDVRMNTKWTQKGRLFLYELLKEYGRLPIIEQGQTA